MKKAFRSCAFWFCIASITIILWNMSGNDSLNIFLFVTNPTLLFIDGTEPFKNLARSMNSDWIWYILHFCTFALYGGIIDSIKNSIKKKS